MIISDIPVHREQNPPATLYFEPDDEEDLAQKLRLKWDSYQGGPDYDLEGDAKERLMTRTVEFGKKYESIVLELINR